MMLSFSACSSRVNSNAIACPTYFNYTHERQITVKDELINCPKCAEVIEFLKDYHVVREQIKVCKK